LEQEGLSQCPEERAEPIELSQNDQIRNLSHYFLIVNAPAYAIVPNIRVRMGMVLRKGKMAENNENDKI
jgi:hypothetical protein